MRYVVIENNSDEMRKIQDQLKRRGWLGTEVPIPEDLSRLQETVSEVLQLRPEVVIVDAALTDAEEEDLRNLKESGARVSRDRFSGLRLIACLKETCPEIPAVLISKNRTGGLSRAAIDVGAVKVVTKKPTDETFGEKADIIVEAAQSALWCSPAFYARLKECVSSIRDTEEGHIAGAALDCFYKASTPARRLGLLCMRLKPWLTEFVNNRADDAIKRVTQRLVDTHGMLSLVDRGLRDHVRHSGNVFWCGYCLMKTISELGDSAGIAKLPSHQPAAFANLCVMGYEKQLRIGWTLAALFHDIAYADEKKEKLEGLVKRVFPSAVVQIDTPNVEQGIEPIVEYVEAVEGGDSALAKALRWIGNNWGKPKGPDGREVVDHGVLGAVRFLETVGDGSVKEELRPLLLQVALAIATHNLPEWMTMWDDRRVDVSAPIGRYPLCGLLMVCDVIQNWDREGDDPAVASSEEDLWNKYILMQTAFVKGPELTKFSIDPIIGGGYNIDASVRYNVSVGEHARDVSDWLYGRIKTWIEAGAGRRVSEKTELAGLLSVRLEYEGPTWPEPLIAKF